MKDRHDKEAMPSPVTNGRLEEGDMAEWLLTYLRDHSSGISEYDLFTALNESGDSRFDMSQLRDTFPLFCAHFRLFNALYRLREQLWVEQLGVLEISPLLIILRPYHRHQGEQNRLNEVDALRDYYLDSAQLEQTTALELEQMLNKFWMRLGGSERRRQALEVLGLRDPAGAVLDVVTIKQQYRRLVMEHHPDRGGDAQQIQLINAAMVVLTEL